MRHAELFKAAKELLIEQREEGVIIPTLAFTAALDYDDDERVRRDRDCLAAAHGGNDWVREAARFSNDYESLTPLGFLGGTLLLRRNTVAVELCYLRDAQMPSMAYITVFESPRTPDPGHVAEVYENALAAYGVPWEEDNGRAMAQHEILDGNIYIAELPGTYNLTEQTYWQTSMCSSPAATMQ